MQFCLSPEQEEVAQAAAKLLSEECSLQRVRRQYEHPSSMDAGLWRQMADLGYCGLVIPEACGGLGLGLLEASLICEQLGHAAAPAALEAHLLASLGLSRSADGADKARWLPALADGSAIGTIAFGEDRGCWAPAEWSVDWDNGVLNGAKRFVTLGDVADVFLVGCRGGLVALVERAALKSAPVNTPGIDRSRGIFDIDFTGAAATPLVAVEAESLFDAALVLSAADAFGAAIRLIGMTSEYSLMRHQFGQPIAQFQSVKHQLADMAASIFGARSLWWCAAHMVDTGSLSAARLASIAKAHITDNASAIGRSSIELHGAIGFTWESDVHLLVKRIIYDKFNFGTPEFHRERSALLGGWLS